MKYTAFIIALLFGGVALAQTSQPIPPEAFAVPIWLSIAMPFLVAFLTSFLQDRETYRAAKALDPTVAFDWTLLFDRMLKALLIGMGGAGVNVGVAAATS